VQQLCAALHVVYPDERFPAVYAKLLAEQARLLPDSGLEVIAY
jgi:hypothetical protein